MATSKLTLLIELQNRLTGGLNSAQRQIKQATGQMQARLSQFSKNNAQALTAISDQIPGASKALGMLANPYVAAGAAAAGFVAIGVKATRMANDWAEQMAEINVTAELSKDKLAALSGKLLEIGSRNVLPLEQIPKAMNTLTSAGLDTKTALAALEPTIRAAKAGFTDVDTVANALAATMSSTGLDATRVLDVMMETVKAGSVEFKDLARYLPEIVPGAQNAGFAIEDTAGALATLTQTLSPQKAATAMQGIMRALSDPMVAVGELDKKTGKYAKGFKSIGISVYDVKGKIKPLTEIMSLLQTRLQGLSDKQRAGVLSKIGLDQMSGLGISALVQNLDALKEATDQVANSQGSMDKAYQDSMGPMDSWKILGNQIKASMIGVGNVFLPIVGAIGDKILGVVTYFKDLYKNSEMFRDILSGIGWVAKTAFTSMTLFVRQYIGAWKFIIGIIGGAISKLSELTEKLTGVEGGLKGMYLKIKPYFIWLKEMIEQIGGMLVSLVTFDFDGLKKAWDNFKMPDLDTIKLRLSVDDSTDPLAGLGTKKEEEEEPATGTGNGLDAANSIAGNSQTKNITINIDSFIKNFSPTSQTINSMNKSELETWLTDTFLRVIRSAELTI